jgi:DNA polymerase-3 subunit gamma/tau
MEKKYQIFARKYRPQTFEDVIGQEATVTILKNSINLNKISQAYLFTGPKGIGKTTLTRILAKAINCKEAEKPCNKCNSCMEITNSASLDVIEIDGASNRGIEDIRNITETVNYSPSSGNYKIYIIDEVHMLTKEAFNALLKTLEEPPATVKFFFATTEPNKVLPTITSRCQRFDLKRISNDLIIKKLKIIVEYEKRDIEEEALHRISNFSDGSLRDAESLLDQILCYTENRVTLEDVNKILGLISYDYFFQLDRAFENVDISKAFTITNDLYNEGKDFSYFLEELTEHFRKILVIKLKKEILNLSEFLREKYENSKKIYSLEQAIYILEVLTSFTKKLKESLSKKTAIELLLLKIIQSKNRISSQVLVKRLINLENSSNVLKENKSSLNQVLEKEKKEEKEEKKLKVEKESEKPIPPPNTENFKKPNNPLIEKPPLMEKQKKEITKLEEVPFSLSFKENKQEEANSKSKSHHDTLLNFTSTELDGIVRREN